MGGSTSRTNARLSGPECVTRVVLTVAYIAVARLLNELVVLAHYYWGPQSLGTYRRECTLMCWVRCSSLARWRLVVCTRRL